MRPPSIGSAAGAGPSFGNGIRPNRLRSDAERALALISPRRVAANPDPGSASM